MTYNKKMAGCAVLAALLFAGCSSRGGQQISIADFGSSGGVDYSGGERQTVSEFASTESIAPDGTSVDEPEEPYTAPEQGTSHITAEPPASEQTTASLSSSSSRTSEPQTTAASSSSRSSKPMTTTEKPYTEETTAVSAPEASSASAAEITSDTAAEATCPEVPVSEPQDYDFGSSTYTALNYPEVKGVWISYIELAEILQGQSRESFRANIQEVFDNCAELGINTVYVHVRSHSDSYYESELFPWSKYVTGTPGEDPGFDPLEIMLNEAHSRDLSFHAWINPLRACGTSQISSYAGYPVYSLAMAEGTVGKYAVDVNGTYYLNPAYEEVTQLIAAGAAEIVSNYDVDGLHIDDYFYPTTDASFDRSAFSSSGYSSLSDFRFANCDRMVSELYSAVKAANPTALFSVSVQGRIDNNYTQLYADVRKWCTNAGYLDVIIPQIYYGFENSTAPYQETLDEWEELASAGGIPLIAGLSVSKVGAEDKWAGGGRNEWIDNHDIIMRQTSAAKKCGSYGGIALYSYRSIFSPEPAVSAFVSKEISALKDII